MASRVEDYSELLEALDEILQGEHDVEIAASAAAIRALLAENAELKAMVDKVELMPEDTDWMNMDWIIKE